MEAVLEIDRELGLGSYEDLAGFESCVVAFPPEVVLGIWAQTLTVRPGAAHCRQRDAAAPDHRAVAVAARLPAARWLSVMADGLVPTAEIEV